MKRRQKKEATPTVRCAVYTRKSTEEGLDQEFNTLDAQRESGEAYIKSQQHEGWTCIPDHYDDGGFTGGNMDRPALRRLMADIESGKVNVVVVYKVDRLSRSLLDFAKMMEVFDQHNVSFASVTQQFNTATSMGRLILNVLLSFAQFEREMISERTRDKIAAARRRGKWSGGMPLLGYDVVDRKLVVNEDESERVREIFEVYLEHLSLLDTVKELDRRGWKTKCWTTKKGKQRGGVPFNKTSLYQLLTNVTYIGKIKYKDEVHTGEHPSIVDTDVFRRVQSALKRNGRSGGVSVRNRYGALLKGLLRCASCDCTMGHTFSTRGNRRYRYYVCLQAQKRGWHECPSPSLSAGEIERFIVEEIKCIGRDPAVIAETVTQVRRLSQERIKRLERERNALRRQLKKEGERQQRLARSPSVDISALAQVQESIRDCEQRLTQVGEDLTSLRKEQVDENEVGDVLASFDDVWDVLSPREQARVINLLIESVTHDGPAGKVSITFRPTGIKTLADEWTQEDAA